MGSGRRYGRLGLVWGVSGSGEMEAPARREAGVRTHAQPPARPRLPSPRRRSACLPACLPVSACLSACDAGRHGQGCRPSVALRRHPSPSPPLFSLLRFPPRSLAPFSIRSPSFPCASFPSSLPRARRRRLGKGPKQVRGAALRQKAPTPAHFRVRMHRGGALTGERLSQSRQARGRLPALP